MDARRPGGSLLLIQVLRAFAVLLVVFYHTGAIIFPEAKYFGTRPLGHLPDMGHAGVDLFFVISGFVITLAHYRDLGRPARAMQYLRKRLVRIYPPYIVAFAIMLAASLALHPAAAELSGGNIIENLLLLPLTWQHEILPVSWTLRFEMLFYAVFLLCILDGRWFVPLVVALATLPILGYCLAGFSAHSIVLLNPQLAQFAMGAGIARLYARRPTRFGVAWVVCGSLLFAAAYTRGVLLGTAAGWDLSSVLLLGVASAAIVYGLACAERTGSLSGPGWLVWIGGASYSIYLAHFPALSLLAKLWLRAGMRDALPDQLAMALLFCFAVGVGCAFHLAVERPLLRWLRPRRRPLLLTAITADLLVEPLRPGQAFAPRWSRPS